MSTPLKSLLSKASDELNKPILKPVSMDKDFKRAFISTPVPNPVFKLSNEKFTSLKLLFFSVYKLSAGLIERPALNECCAKVFKLNSATNNIEIRSDDFIPH